MLAHALRVADRIIERGGDVSFEWPKSCAGWLLPELVSFQLKHSTYEAVFDGCDFGLVSEENEPIKKGWRVTTTSSTLANNLNQHKCRHDKDFRHCHAKGSKTANTAFYPKAICETIITSLFPEKVHGHVPCIICKPKSSFDSGHNPKSDSATDVFNQPAGFVFEAEGLDELLEVLCDAAIGAPEVHATVTRLLTRKEMMNDPKLSRT